MGQGTPYAALQKVTVPIRFFYQLYALQFFPIVNSQFYKSGKDLDGQETTVHARGSGTEAIMNLMAKEHGIKYKNISYVPGPDVRALGLIRGVKGVVIGQLLVSIIGVGELFELYSKYFLMEEFWFLVIVVFAFAFILSEAISYFERRVEYYAGTR